MTYRLQVCGRTAASFAFLAVPSLTVAAVASQFAGGGHKRANRGTQRFQPDSPPDISAISAAANDAAA